MQKKKFPVVSIIFYVLAFLMLAYSIWAASYSIKYVGDAIAQGQLIIEGYEFEIASFYMSNFVQFVIFAALLFGIGWIVQAIQADKNEEMEEEIEFVEELLAESDEEVEEKVEEEMEEEDDDSELIEE